MSPQPVASPLDKMVVVGMGELAISTRVDERLATYALGSCVAVIVHDPLRSVGGIVHYMLPSSSVAPAKAAQTPGMFADTGVPLLFRTLYERQCRKHDLIIKVAGGGHLLGELDAYDIGSANVKVLAPMFQRAGVTVSAWDVGGTASRTVELNIGTGAVTIKSGGMEKRL